MTLFRASLLTLLASSLLASNVACNNPPPSDEPVEETGASTSPLEQTFDEAALRYQVPKGLLKSIAYVETRASPKVGKSAFGGWGMMHLVEREDWNAVARAAELTGLDKGRVMLDVESNVFGAAALLRQLADESFRDYADLHPRDPGAFFHAVSLYPGFSSAPLAQQYARDVFGAWESGFEVENADGTIVQAPTFTTWRDYAPAATRQDGAKEYPGAYQWKASPNYSSGRTSYTYVVIHTVQGSYSGCISWFQNSSSNVSSHYVVRSSDGQVTQMVEHKDTAWHAGCYNSRSIGIEHEGYVNDPARWYTDAMYGESAKLTRYIADRHAIPKTRSRIIGHVEVGSINGVNCNKNAHYDPGTGWNWTKYMGLVNGTGTTPTTGKVTGVIYTNGSSSNTVSGATVTAGGKTVTTGTNGLYEFVLNPGTYTVNVSKSGYGSNSVSRTVTAGSTVWGSMEINPTAATGKIIGFMYTGAAGVNDPGATRLSGVTVKAGGKTDTSAADGRYEFDLAPGTYTVTATKTGYNNASVTKTVTANATVYGSMGMTSTSTPPPADTTKPELEISFPENNEVLTFAELTLTGTVSDNKDAIASVTLQVNGGAAATVSVASGKYSQVIKLSPGANTLKVTAKDAANNTQTVTHTVTFDSGLFGRVYSFDESGEVEVPLEGVTVELLQPSTGELVTSAVSGADGVYELDTVAVGQELLLAARLEGYITSVQTLLVPDDQRLEVDVPMTPGSMVPTELAVTFLDPTDGAEIDAAEASVYGTVEGMLLSSVTVNGITADIMGDVSFFVAVPLNYGANEIVAEAHGIGGEIVTARMTLTRPGSAPTTGVPAPGGESKSLAPAKGGCSATGGFELFALLALTPLFRRRRR